MTTTTGSLLPPFDPLPQLNTTFQTIPPTPHDLTPLPSTAPSLDYFTSCPSSSSDSIPSPVSAVSPTSSSSSFFGRLRSNSLHSSAPSVPSSLRRSASPPPPMPSLASFPLASSASLHVDYLSQSQEALPSTSSAPTCPPIKNVTIPHFSKSGKRALFACRVVPDVVAQNDGAHRPAHVRRESLGRMMLAGEGEPHTVWRTWSEFVEFSSRLVEAFPDNRAVKQSPTGLTALPSSTLDNHVPRLNKKLVLFMTRSTLSQRQAELETFCRRLFHMPSEVKYSSIVRDFFRVRPQDTLGSSPSAMSSASSLEAPAFPPASASLAMAEDWYSAGDPANDLALPYSPNATLKAPKPKMPRPSLAVKISSPNLRSAIRGFGGGGNTSTEDEVYSPTPLSTMGGGAGAGFNLLRPLLANRGVAVDLGEFPRPDSKCSMATSSSSMTITPGAQTAREQTRSPLPPAVSAVAEQAKTIKKKRSGPLRHFRSLQDLRGSSKQQAAVPEEPVPSLAPAFAAAAMARAASQPLSRGPAPPPLPLASSSRRPSGASPFLPPAPYSAPLGTTTSRHRRTGSSKSSTSSIEDLWGTPFPSFRQTPSGRVECVPRGEEHRRPSLGGTFGSQSLGRNNSFGPAASSSSFNRPPLHRGSGQRASSASISSVGSNGSAESSAPSRSGRSSMEWSAPSEACPTPPTPQTEWAGDKFSAGKYYVENGVLLENNMVPPPPFFPVPPPMQFAYSQDGLPHTPRSTTTTSSSHSHRSSHSRKSSSDLTASSSSRSRSRSHSHSRTGSIASSRHVRSSLDPILASPAASSAASSSPRTSAGGAGKTRTFKLLHRDENVILRLSRTPDVDLDLEHFRSEVEAKFRACGVALAEAGGEWGLGWTTKSAASNGDSEGALVTKLIVGQEDLERCLKEQEGQGKIVLKVIC
ncbi:hypothetical protein JCM11641_004917 [Rhodosporidiobolus odoratus]